MSQNSISRNTHRNQWIKYGISFIGIFLVRLIPFRAPNVEPIMATIMPFSKRFGAISTFLFAFLSIALFDAVTSGIGIWTVVTAVAYGLVALAATAFFTGRAASVKNFVLFTIPATIAYDAVTGLTVGPLFFHQTLLQAVVGQIPFTLLHLTGNIAFAILLSPVLAYWLAKDEVFVGALGMSTYRATSLGN